MATVRSRWTTFFGAVALTALGYSWSVAGPTTICGGGGPVGARSDARTVRGRVLGPDGRPVSGAEIVLDDPGREPAVLATTGPDGSFRAEIDVSEPVGPGRREDGGDVTRLVARAEGLGPDWAGFGGADSPAEITFRLVVDDVPIDGRVLDLEGQPIEGVGVRVRRLERADGGDLGPWIEAWRDRARGKDRAVAATTGIRAEAAGVPASATTGKDGRFRLAGLGRDRVVRLTIRGKDVEVARLTAVTRAGVDGLPAERGVYGAAFEYLAGPIRPIVGTVRDKQTGEPLRGVLVCGGNADRLNSEDASRAVTDEHGRYRLGGVGKHPRYWLTADAVPYFHSTKMPVPDVQGTGPLEVDFALVRGVAVRGRLTEKATGRPIRGRVSYIPALENARLEEFSDLRRDPFYAIPLPEAAGQARADGRYTVIAAPGEGWLCARAEEADRYAAAEVAGWDGRLIPTLVSTRAVSPRMYHAMIKIRPAEGAARPTLCDIALEPGRTRAGTVVGPDGRPLAGTHVAGLTPNPHDGPSEGLKGDTFAAVGLHPRRSRTLAFFHPGEKLGKIQPVAGDGDGPVAVRLEPLGALSGRVLGADSAPWSGLQVTAYPEGSPEESKVLPFELFVSWRAMTEVKARTDTAGRFRLDGLLPGVTYQLVVTDGDFEKQAFVAHDELVRLAGPGIKDLGDLKARAPVKKKGE